MRGERRGGKRDVWGGKRERNGNVFVFRAVWNNESKRGGKGEKYVESHLVPSVRLLGRTVAWGG